MKSSDLPPVKAIEVFGGQAFETLDGAFRFGRAMGELNLWQVFRRTDGPSGKYKPLPKLSAFRLKDARKAHAEWLLQEAAKVTT